MTSKFEAQEGCHETSSILKTINIRCYQAKFSCLGDLAPGICAPLLLVILRNLMQGYFYWILYQDLFKFGTCCSLYRVSQEEWTKLRESVPYVKIYRYNPKHLCPKLNGYGDKGQRKVWYFCCSTYCTWFA